MEFPSLGVHCNQNACKQLDFLPMKCNGCKKMFCQEHLFFTRHSCPTAYLHDNKVPTCPLCLKPVPLGQGENADIKVNRHIDDDCQSDPANEHRGKIYKNGCTYKNCKIRELVPFNCTQCGKNFCIKHRHESDHGCLGKMSLRQINASAAEKRMQVAKSSQNTVKPALNSDSGKDLRLVQNGMSDGDALALAIRLSTAPDVSSRTLTPSTLEQQEAADAALAAALYSSQLEEQERQLHEARSQGRQNQSLSTNNNCSVS